MQIDLIPGSTASYGRQLPEKMDPSLFKGHSYHVPVGYKKKNHKKTRISHIMLNRMKKIGELLLNQHEESYDSLLQSKNMR